MQATIIVKHAQTDKIVNLFTVYSLDETTVEHAVRTIKRVHGDECKIDTSQIELARRALMPGCFAAA